MIRDNIWESTAWTVRQTLGSHIDVTSPFSTSSFRASVNPLDEETLKEEKEKFSLVHETWDHVDTCWPFANLAIKPFHIYKFTTHSQSKVLILINPELKGGNAMLGTKYWNQFVQSKFLSGTSDNPEFHLHRRLSNSWINYLMKNMIMNMHAWLL